MSNRIPDGWQVLDLAEICYFQEGPGLRRWQYTDSGFPFINIRCIQDNRLDLSNVQYISADEANTKYKHFQLDAGDLVMSSSGTLGRMAVVRKSDLPIMLNTSVIRFRSTDEKRLSSNFLPQYLKSKDFLDQITEESQGSAQVNFGPTHLKLVVCTLPPIEEQRKIAAILTSVDEVIESTTAQINKLKDLKTGMMQELLTKGIGHTEFKDSPVGRIPKAWEVVAIKELCSVIVDCVNKTAPVVDYRTPYKMIRTTNVRNGRIDTDNVRFVTKETYEQWTRRTPPIQGDIIFTREAPVGEVGILNDAKGIFLGQRTMMYRVDPLKCVNTYLLYSLQSNYCKQQLEDFSGGSTVAHMRVPDCSEIKIIVPPFEEQIEISRALSSIDRLIETKETRNRIFEDKKKGLMQDLLTGKVRVQ